MRISSCHPQAHPQASASDPMQAVVAANALQPPGPTGPALGLLHNLPDNVMQQIIDIGTANGPKKYLLGLMGTCHTLDPMCRAAVFHHIIIRATNSLDPFADATTPFLDGTATNAVTHVRIVQFHSSTHINGGTQRRNIYLHSVADVVGLIPHTAMVIVHAGDLVEVRERLEGTLPCFQVERLLFHDVGMSVAGHAALERPPPSLIGRIFPGTTQVDLISPAVVESALEASSTLEDPLLLPERNTIRDQYIKQTALFVSLLDGMPHVKTVGYQPNSSISFFPRDDLPIPFRPDLFGGRTLHKVVFTLAVPEHALTHGFPELHDLICHMIASGPPSMKIVQFVLSFSCGWPTKPSLAALQAKDVRVEQLLRAVRALNNGVEVQFAIRDEPQRTGGKAPSRTMIARILPELSTNSLRTSGASWAPNETQVDLYEDFLRASGALSFDTPAVHGLLPLLDGAEGERGTDSDSDESGGEEEDL